MTAIENDESTERASAPEDHQRDERLADTAEQAVKGLVDLGRLWAAHGLNIGRSALEASAATLRTTAEVLGEIARRFEPSDDEPDAV